VSDENPEIEGKTLRLGEEFFAAGPGCQGFHDRLDHAAGEKLSGIRFVKPEVSPAGAEEGKEWD
jgi:hypothetical protein